MIRPSRLIFPKNMALGTHPIGMFAIEGLIHHYPLTGLAVVGRPLIAAESAFEFLYR